jgi:UDP-glucose-4-epimerase GalE
LREERGRRADGREVRYYWGDGALGGAPSPVQGDAVLVTGGAGYVAGPVVARLAAEGPEVIVLDDLSTSSGRTLPARGVTLVRAGVGDAVALREIFARWRIRGVFHFAADSRVGESMQQPLPYFRHNVRDPLPLLEQVVAAGCPPFVFSSSAAVYGVPAVLPVAETEPTCPVNPYGETKAHFERILHWVGEAHGLPWAALRYFNAAGADGPWEPKVPETHLIPNVLAAAAGGPPLRVFGGDYATADGTAVRDYVHVADLAAGHLAALRHLRAGGASGPFNLGTGRGHSVAEIVAAVERVTGLRVAREVVARRPGDPPVLVADVRRAAAVLGWTAACSDLDRIVADAWSAYRQAAAPAGGAVR